MNDCRKPFLPHTIISLINVSFRTFFHLFFGNGWTGRVTQMPFNLPVGKDILPSWFGAIRQACNLSSSMGWIEVEFAAKSFSLPNQGKTSIRKKKKKKTNSYKLVMNNFVNMELSVHKNTPLSANVILVLLRRKCRREDKAHPATTGTCLWTKLFVVFEALFCRWKQTRLPTVHHQFIPTAGLWWVDSDDSVSSS